MDAAVEGLVDYREARILDPRWWQRCRILYKALERKKRNRALDVSYRLTLAQVANSGLTESSFRRVQDRAIEMQHDLIGAELPWEGRDYKDRKSREFSDARQKYMEAFGQDPSDPVFKAHVAETVRRVIAGEFDEVQETPSEQIIAQRMQERSVREQDMPKRRR